MREPLLEAPGVSLNVQALLSVRPFVHRSMARRRLVPSGQPGGIVTRRRGRGLEAAEVRVFSEGDDVRHLDRNTTARTGVPHVRTYQDERDKTALLVADFRTSMLWGTRRVFRSVAAAQALAAVGWRVIETGGRVGAIAIAADGRPWMVRARGREKGMVSTMGGLVAAHAAALQAAASFAQSAPEPPLSNVFETAARLLTKSGGSLFLGTALDHPGEAFDQAVGALARRAKLTVLLIQDAFELMPPPGHYRYATRPGLITSASITGLLPSRAPDPRVERLKRLGVEVVRVDASCDLGDLVRQVEGTSDEGR